MFGRCGDCKQLIKGKRRTENASIPRPRVQHAGVGKDQDQGHAREQGTMFKTKSVHSPIAGDDGLRVLAARGRGRGLPADRFDVWMANLGPREERRAAILAGRISWSEYSRRYLNELRESGGVDARNKRIKN